MWQRCGDCILCDLKSIPHTQGLVIQQSTRTMVMAFNKTLQFLKYEQSNKEFRARRQVDHGISGIYQGFKGQNKLPYYLRTDEDLF